jgi:hypothetical protein
MAMHAVRADAGTPPTSRPLCWVESLTLGLGIPAMIWLFSKFITGSIPAAVSGSAEQPAAAGPEMGPESSSPVLPPASAKSLPWVAAIQNS